MWVARYRDRLKAFAWIGGIPQLSRGAITGERGRHDAIVLCLDRSEVYARTKYLIEIVNQEFGHSGRIIEMIEIFCRCSHRFFFT